MKKQIMCVMLVAFSLSLSACGNSSSPGETTSKNVEVDSSTEKTTKKEVKETDATTVEESTQVPTTQAPTTQPSTTQPPTTQPPTTQPPTTQPPTQISIQARFQNIYNEYVNKMGAKAPELVAEYKQRSAGITDISTLATICNNEVGKLADICVEGVGEMADIYISGGTDYSTYESWAMKLQNKYAELARPIQDAYTNSAMQ